MIDMFVLALDTGKNMEKQGRKKLTTLWDVVRVREMVPLPMSMLLLLPIRYANTVGRISNSSAP